MIFALVDNVETLDFKFLLRPKDTNVPCIVEEGPDRILSGGRLQGEAREAVFRFKADDTVEYKVCIKADRVSPFDLAASWRAYQENRQPSAVRDIPDVSISSVPETSMEVHFSSPPQKKSSHQVQVAYKIYLLCQ